MIRTLFIVQLTLASVKVYSQQPNILLIMGDDISIGSLSIYGSPDVQTPHFDRIATEGILFKNAFTSNPKCSPLSQMILVFSCLRILTLYDIAKLVQIIFVKCHNANRLQLKGITILNF